MIPTIKLSQLVRPAGSRFNRSRSHRLISPMAGAIRRNPLPKARVARGFATCCPRQPGPQVPLRPVGPRCAGVACLAMAGVQSIGTVPATNLGSKP